LQLLISEIQYFYFLIRYASSSMTLSAVSSFVPAASTSSSAAPVAREPSKQAATDPCLWEIDSMTELQDWIQSHAPLYNDDPGIAMQLWYNVSHALDALHETVQEQEALETTREINGDHDDDDNPMQILSSMGPPKKKKKRIIRIRTLHDPFHIWLQAWKTQDGQDEESTIAPEATLSAPRYDATMLLTDDHDDVPSTCGAKLSQLSIGGLVNALALVSGGCVHKPTPFLNASPKEPIASAANISLHQ
jgi:hypothetical protein